MIITIILTVVITSLFWIGILWSATNDTARQIEQHNKRVCRLVSDREYATRN